MRFSHVGLKEQGNQFDSYFIGFKLFNLIKENLK
jgi:hypothetical protein